MEKTVLALRHTPSEDLGLFEPQLKRMGFDVRYVDVSTRSLRGESPMDCGIVVVLGGPVPVSQLEHFPYLQEEVRWLRARILEDLPTLGISFGAQLMALAAGAQIVTHGQHYGWSTLQPGPSSTAGGCLSPFLGSSSQVVQWHCDYVGLPPGADDFAQNADGISIAFGIGKSCLGLQFHPELDVSGIEQWLVNGVNEVSRAGNFDISAFRSNCQVQAASTRKAARDFLQRWLRKVRLEERGDKFGFSRMQFTTSNSNNVAPDSRN